MTENDMKPKKDYRGIEKKVYTLVADPISEAGYTVWDVSYFRSGGGNVLEITIDRDDGEGVGIADCELVSRLIDPIIDGADPIDAPYSLNISSPGIERDLTLPRHFDACAGMKAELRFYRPLPGTTQKKLTGVLGGYSQDSDSVAIECEEGKFDVHFADIAGAKLVWDFDDGEAN